MDSKRTRDIVKAHKEHRITTELARQLLDREDDRIRRQAIGVGPFRRIGRALWKLLHREPKC